LSTKAIETLWLEKGTLVRMLKEGPPKTPIMIKS
jgi:hypothetical protein